MTEVRSVNRWPWISALVLSFAITGIVVVAFLQIGPTPKTTYIVPPLVSAIAAFLFAIRWPSGSWRWGLILSSGFLVFFLAVFLSYLSVGQPEFITIGRAVSVVLAAVAGSVVATRMRRTKSTTSPGGS
jgi:peptidoglycan/LPS O-acetylase OafA/YrhL